MYYFANVLIYIILLQEKRDKRGFPKTTILRYVPYFHHRKEGVKGGIYLLNLTYPFYALINKAFMLLYKLMQLHVQFNAIVLCYK